MTAIDLKTNLDWYSRHDAAIMSAIGVLLMIAHHLFGFQDFLSPEVGWSSMLVLYGIEIEHVIAAFGKICVALFAFNSGYVVWKMQHSYLDMFNRIKRIISFLVSYWIVLLLFWIYAIIVGDPLPSYKDTLMNLVGLNTGPDKIFVNIPFAWYVAYYVSFIILSPILLKLFSRSLTSDIILFILLGIILQFIKCDFLSPLMIGIEGMLFAKYSLFQRFAEKIPTFRIHMFLITTSVLVIIRQGYILLNIRPFDILGGVDFFIVPIFIFTTTVISRKTCAKYLTNILILIAACSMNLWFLHGIFFTANRPLQPLLYSSGSPVIIYITVLALTLPVAYSLHFVQQRFLTLLKLT